MASKAGVKIKLFGMPGIIKTSPSLQEFTYIKFKLENLAKQKSGEKSIGGSTH